MRNQFNLTFLAMFVVSLFNVNFILAQSVSPALDTLAAAALRAYLDRDCGVIKKGDKSPLERLLEFKSNVAVQKALADIAGQGRSDLLPTVRPDLASTEDMRRQLERQWDKYVDKPPSQFTSPRRQGTQDGPPLSRETYINLRLAELQEGARKKATVALNAMKGSTNPNSPQRPKRFRDHVGGPAVLQPTEKSPPKPPTITVR
jgi:hypothetical protein